MGSFARADMEARGAVNDQTSSAVIKTGFVVDFYDGGNFGRFMATLGAGTYDLADLVANGVLNDRTSAIVVRAVSK